MPPLATHEMSPLLPLRPPGRHQQPGRPDVGGQLTRQGLDSATVYGAASSTTHEEQIRSPDIVKILVGAAALFGVALCLARLLMTQPLFVVQTSAGRSGSTVMEGLFLHNPEARRRCRLNTSA